ncbi:MAG: fluoride efflux transporter CrcB [Planctomycetes bacterium]|nr:fluoride efflux transporter CrcB [Planctomycetota bacterium]
MERLIWVSVGGALGSAARYLLAGWIFRVAGPAFPWGTLAVNVLGSLLLGFLMVLGLETDSLSPNLRAGLATGVLGGFTTYSTFNHETTLLLREGAWPAAAANVLGTLAACLAAGFLGHLAGRWAIGR